VRKGGLRDAILYSCGANADHGTRRTNADKRQSVSKLLEDEEWAHWTDSEIARRCHVSQPFVGELRRSLIIVISENDGGEHNDEDQLRTYRNRHGNTGTMRTGNIGRGNIRRRAEDDEPVLQEPWSLHS
jgi:hypothetical protein